MFTECIGQVPVPVFAESRVTIHHLSQYKFTPMNLRVPSDKRIPAVAKMILQIDIPLLLFLSSLALPSIASALPVNSPKILNTMHHTPEEIVTSLAPGSALVYTYSSQSLLLL